MQGTNDTPAARERQRVQAAREELVERITQAVPDDGTLSRSPELLLRRASAPTQLGHGVSVPCLLRDRAGQQGDPAGRHAATGTIPRTT